MSQTRETNHPAKFRSETPKAQNKQGMNKKLLKWGMGGNVNAVTIAPSASESTAESRGNFVGRCELEHPARRLYTDAVDASEIPNNHRLEV